MSDAAMETVFDYFHADGVATSTPSPPPWIPDVVHQGVLPELVCNGRRAVAERMAASLDGGDTGIERLELHAAGESVVVAIAGPRFREIPFLNGEIFMLFTVHDRRILRIDDYRTREEAFAAVEAPAPANP